VIFVTTYETIDSAVKAVKRGALCYITKPLTPERLLHLTRKAMEEIRLRRENETLRRELERRYTYKDLIGKSARMQEVFQLLEKPHGHREQHPRPGKERNREGAGGPCHPRPEPAKRPPVRRAELRRADRDASWRASSSATSKGPSPAPSAPSRACFRRRTGAPCSWTRSRNMPLSMQVKLLRTIQEGEIKPVGSNQTVRVDVRFIAATNRISCRR